MLNSYCVQSVLPDPSGNGLAGFGISGALHPLLQSMLTSQPHSCTCAVPCCAYLQVPDQGLLSQKSAAVSPATSVLSHGVVLPTPRDC